MRKKFPSDTSLPVCIRFIKRFCVRGRKQFSSSHMFCIFVQDVIDKTLQLISYKMFHYLIYFNAQIG